MPHDTAVERTPTRDPVSSPGLSPTGSAASPAVPNTYEGRPSVPQRTEPGKAGILTWIIWLVVLGGVGGGIYWIYRHFHPTATDASNGSGGPGGKSGRGGGGGAFPVVASRTRRGNMDIYLNGLGSVQSLNTVTVRTRIDGQVDRIYFTEGQLVHKGDLLFQIDPRPYQVQLTQAKAQKSKDESVLSNAENELRRNVEAAEAVPKITVENQQAVVAQAKAALNIDDSQIASVELNLKYTAITAPITGRIGLKVVDEGNMVHANDSSGLAVITQMQPIGVVFNLPEDNLPQIRRHLNSPFGFMLPSGIRRTLETPVLTVEAYDRDFTHRIAAGRLLALDSQIDPTTGTVRLKGEFRNDDESLFPNQFVNARLLISTRRNVAIIPTAAIQRSPQGTFVYVISPDKSVEMRPITTGPSEGDETVVETGLYAGGPDAFRKMSRMLNNGRIGWLRVIENAEGDVVVTDGVDKLQNGTKVTPTFKKRGSDGPTTNPTGDLKAQPAGGEKKKGDGKRGGGKPAGDSATQGQT